MKKNIPWEHVLDDKAYLNVGSKVIKVTYSHVDRTLQFDVPEEPKASWGTAECYCCGKDFKWSHTPGVIPECDRCISWTRGD